jgi:hypothetical protein
MSDPQGPSESLFLSLFDAALEDFEKQTGASLARHPLAIKLDACKTVESINASLQEQAKAFRQFRGDDGKVTRCLKGVVRVLHKLSTTGVLGEGIGLVCRNSLTTSSEIRSLTTFCSRSRLRRRYSWALVSFSPYVSSPSLCKGVL